MADGDLQLPVPAPLVDAIADAVAARLGEQAQAAAPATLPVKAGRLALTKAEAAEAIGISVDHLERHVLPDLRIVRSGRLRLIPAAELEAWLDRNAARLGEWR
jgi:excisionase family DNA binding protein